MDLDLRAAVGWRDGRWRSSTRPGSRPGARAAADHRAEVVEALGRLAVRGAPAIGVAVRSGWCWAAEPARPGRPDGGRRPGRLERAAAAPGGPPDGGQPRWAVRRVLAAAAAPPTPPSCAASPWPRRSRSWRRTAPPAADRRARPGRAGRARPAAHPLQHRPPRHRRAGHGARRRLRQGRGRRAGRGARLRDPAAAPGRPPDRLGADQRRHPGHGGGRRRRRRGLAGGRVDAVLVGCDRVAANGDTANKIGTYSLACSPRANQLPFYVAGRGRASTRTPPPAPTSRSSSARRRGPRHRRPRGGPRAAGSGTRPSTSPRPS